MTFFEHIPMAESLIRAKIKKLLRSSQNLNSNPSHKKKASTITKQISSHLQKKVE